MDEDTYTTAAMKVKVATTKMAFMWRRRSSLLKIVVITMAIWCMVALVFYSESSRRDGQAAGSGQDNDAVPMALKRDYDSMGQRDIKVNKRRGDSGDNVANNEIGDEEGDMPVISNEDVEEVVKENKRPQRQRWRKNKPAKKNDMDGGEYTDYADDCTTLICVINFIRFPQRQSNRSGGH